MGAPGSCMGKQVHGKHSDLDLLLFTKAHSSEIRASCMLCHSFLLLSVHLRKIFSIKAIHLWFHVERLKFLYFISYLKTGYYNILSQDRLNPRYFPTLMLHQCVIMHSYVLELRYRFEFKG